MRTLTLVCPGTGSSTDHLPDLNEHTDCMVINCAYINWKRAYPEMLPAYHLCIDPPDRFCTEWHQDKRVRSLIRTCYLKQAKLLDYKNYIMYSQLGPEFPNSSLDPFCNHNYSKPLKTILTAVQWAVKMRYERVLFYGCGFHPVKKGWYDHSKEANEESEREHWRGRCRSLERELVYLRCWQDHLPNYNCEWVSITKDSRLHQFMKYMTVKDALK